MQEKEVDIGTTDGNCTTRGHLVKLRQVGADKGEENSELGGMSLSR